MSPFIYCNQCFNSTKDTKHGFFISNCYHVFCAECLTNDKNFCRKCDKKSKLLPIDKNLPNEVKIFFEDNFIQKQIRIIDKVHEFRQTQAKEYAAKLYCKRKNYYQLKPKLIELKKYKMTLIENKRREKAIMEKLKDAYKTNVITPQLFQMRSQANSPYGIKTPEEMTKSTNSTRSTGLSAESSVFHENNHRTKEIPYMDMSKNTQNYQSSKQVSIGGKENIIRDARKNIIAHTLRDMNQATQRKTQIRESQMKRL